MGHDVIAWAELAFASKAALKRWRQTTLNAGRLRGWPTRLRGRTPKRTVAAAIEAWQATDPTWLEVSAAGTTARMVAVFDGGAMSTLGRELLCAVAAAADEGAAGRALLDDDGDVIAVHLADGSARFEAATRDDLRESGLAEVRAAAEQAAEAELAPGLAETLAEFEASVARSRFSEADIDAENEALARAYREQRAQAACVDVAAFALPAPKTWIAPADELFDRTASWFTPAKLRTKSGPARAIKAMKQARACEPPDGRWWGRARDLLLVPHDDRRVAWKLAQHAGPVMWHCGPHNDEQGDDERGDGALCADVARLLAGGWPAHLYGVATVGLFGGPKELEIAIAHAERCAIDRSLSSHLSDAIVRVATRHPETPRLVSARLATVPASGDLRYAYEVALEAIDAGAPLDRGAPRLF